MNIFNVSHAMVEIEEGAKECGLDESHLILFYMWLSDDRFPGHSFDDVFIGKLIKDMKPLIKEFETWVKEEARRANQSSLEPW